MTESDESTIEEAKTHVSDPNARNLFKAIRMMIADGEVRSETIDLLRAEAYTYRDLDTVLRLLPPPGTSEQSSQDPDVGTGFLASIDSLLRQLSRGTLTGGSKTSDRDLRRTYVYAQRLYDVTATAGKGYADDLPAFRGASPYISSFEVHNRTSGEVTKFQIAFGTIGPLTAAPLRVIFRPRWWLELQLDRSS
jgi:hypothetical protein